MGAPPRRGGGARLAAETVPITQGAAFAKHIDEVPRPPAAAVAETDARAFPFRARGRAVTTAVRCRFLPIISASSSSLSSSSSPSTYSSSSL